METQHYLNAKRQRRTRVVCMAVTPDEYAAMVRIVEGQPALPSVDAVLRAMVGRNLRAAVESMEAGR